MVDQISNSGGTLTLTKLILSLREKQIYDVAIKKVPTRNLLGCGAIIDTETYHISPRVITIIGRFSKQERGILSSIVNTSKMVSIVFGDWEYDAWISTKKLKYEYRKYNEIVRPWVIQITLVVDSRTGGP